MSIQMTEYVFLSHELDEETPGYGGAQCFTKEIASKISDGKSSNSQKWIFSNHCGTHVDLPLHFDDQGKSLSDFSQPQDWIFDHTQVLNIKVGNDFLIQISDLDGLIEADCDFLILKTKFENKRESKEYWNNNPGVHSEVGHYLRKNYPNIKAIGMDFISLTAFQHREEGRKAHRAFLAPFEKHPPIRIIEDMKLSQLSKNPSQVIVCPLQVKMADGTQVTIIAKS